MSGKIGPAVCSFVVCLGLFFGFFFGLVYPEVRKNTLYQKTKCMTLSTQVVPYRDCYKSCGGCSSCSLCISCSVKMGIHSTRDKYDLDTFGISGTCGNGYECCSQCCETCTRCYDTCSRRLSAADRFLGYISGSSDSVEDQELALVDPIVVADADGNEVAISPRDLKNNDDSSSCTPRRVCESYSCNCYCCSSVANERCTITCGTAYESWQDLQFATKAPGDDAQDYATGATVTTRIVRDHGGSQAEAQAFVDQPDLAPESSVDCWYDPDWTPSSTMSSSELAYAGELGYSPGYFVLLAIPIIAILAAFMVCTSSLIAGKCGEDAQPVPGACAIWFGLIIPVVIFLPIALDGNVPLDDRVIVGVFACVFGGLFWLPLVMMMFGPAAGAACCVVWVIPLAIVAPVLLGMHIWAGAAGMVAFAVAIVALAVVCLRCKEMRDSSRTRDAVRRRRRQEAQLEMHRAPAGLKTDDGSTKNPHSDRGLKDPSPPVATAPAVAQPPIVPGGGFSTFPEAPRPQAQRDAGRATLRRMREQPPTSEYQALEVFRALQAAISANQTKVTKEEVTRTANAVHMSHPDIWSAQVAMAYGKTLKLLVDKQPKRGPTVL